LLLKYDRKFVTKHLKIVPYSKILDLPVLSQKQSFDPIFQTSVVNGNAKVET